MTNPIKRGEETIRMSRNEQIQEWADSYSAKEALEKIK